MLRRLLIVLFVFAVSMLIFAGNAKYSVVAEKCIGCKLCVNECPTKAITMVKNKAIIDPAKCVNCGLCAKKCPTKAIIPPTKVEKKNAEVAPEAKKEQKKTVFKIDLKKCTGCKDCVKTCPTKAITMIKGKAVIDVEKCVNCGLCAKACRTSAPHSTGL